MTQLETLYLQYFKSISEEMMSDTSPFAVMTSKVIEQFNSLGLTNEEKAKALVSIYAQETASVNSEASKASLVLLDQDRKDALVDAQIETEERKKQGYDDNVLIEILKAQGGLASFAVNANSDTAQDTIDDLHAIMDTIEDRVCDLVCDTPSFELEFTTDHATPISGNIFGAENLTYDIVEQPEKGTLVVNSDGTFVYTPQNDVDGIGIIKFMVKTTDNTMSVMTVGIITVISV
jgi:hypothetical protein